ncbi:nitroreductase family protein [Anaerosinus massiliensis]|uniref:nitroreductase family protein n=1 Tax=Massilibacillus massiliensis TaxID=1806837 RepID=UPI000A979888|nr:nitroreductase family protein [Massilibacillus massiliensis]
METLKTIAMRKSTRSYKSEQISEQELDTILCAGCAAPVGNGAYGDVHLTVIQKIELLNNMTKIAANGFGDPALKPFYGAPTVVMVSVKKNKLANVACIIETMHLAATDLGLGSVYLSGFLKPFLANDKLLKELIGELQLPEGFSPVSAIALGYPTEPLTEIKESKKKITVNTIR